MNMFQNQVSFIDRGRHCFKYGDTTLRTGCIIVSVCGNVMMIKDTYRGKEMLSFPGGTCDAGDEDIFDTSIREFYEEAILGDQFQGQCLQNWSSIRNQARNNPQNTIDHLLNHLYRILPHSPFWIGGKGLKTCYFKIDIPYDLRKMLNPQYMISLPQNDMYKKIIKTSDGRQYAIRGREKEFLSGLIKLLNFNIPHTGTSIKNIDPKNSQIQCDIFNIWCLAKNPNMSERLKKRIKICCIFISMIRSGDPNLIQQVYDHSYHIGFTNLRICFHILNECENQHNIQTVNFSPLPHTERKTADILKKVYIDRFKRF